jgi:hypothetical protein
MHLSENKILFMQNKNLSKLKGLENNTLKSVNTRSRSYTIKNTHIYINERNCM